MVGLYPFILIRSRTEILRPRSFRNSIATRRYEKTIILFASPQGIVDKPHWKKFLKELIKRKLLRLVDVDEIQLFVHYGLSFCHQFAMLSTTLFRDFKINKHTTKIPVLSMTATCTVEILKQLQTLTGLSFYKDNMNICWPNSIAMQKRNIFTRVLYITRPF